jgi:hypothetical protein
VNGQLTHIPKKVAKAVKVLVENGAKTKKEAKGATMKVEKAQKMIVEKVSKVEKAAKGVADKVGKAQKEVKAGAEKVGKAVKYVEESGITGKEIKKKIAKQVINSSPAIRNLDPAHLFFN